MSTVRLTFKAADPTREMVARVVKLGEGGETCFEKADLRPADERWWTEVVDGLVQALRKDLDTMAASDEALVSEIPETAYRGLYSDRDKARVREDFLKARRRGRAWVITVGFMLRDAERILHEGLFKGDQAIRARNQLKAFAFAIAIEVGCATLVDEPEDQRPADREEGVVAVT